MEVSWLFKTAGDTQQYTLNSKEGGTTVYSANVVKSIRWPGATTVFQNGKWLSIYIGNGVKATGICFMPIAPQEIKDDPEDQEEHPEPNPKDALEKLESDTDAEKKPEEGENPESQ